jgi:hypothetical protein
LWTDPDSSILVNKQIRSKIRIWFLTSS